MMTRAFLVRELLPLIFLVCLINSCWCLFGNGLPKTPKHTKDGEDPGKPLFLTPLIEAGEFDLARKQSLVGPLPDAPQLTSYSGYLTVNKKYNSNMFFWFFPAATGSHTAPVLLWLQGGPGGSSLFGLFAENGPFIVSKDLKISRRKYSWASQFSVIYIDNPVGTGFSFTDSDSGFATNEQDVGRDLLECLKQFFTLFSEYQKNEFYVTGESYAGKYVPAIAYQIHKEKPTEINLKGIAIGDGLIDPESQFDYSDYLYQIGLLDENQRDYFQKEQNIALKFIQQKKFRDAFQIFDILLNGDTIKEKSYFTNCTGMTNYYNFLYTSSPEDQNYYGDYLAKGEVRAAIHVGNLTYNDGQAVEQHLLNDVMDSVKSLVETLLDNYKVMIYSGQLDVIIAYPLTANFLQTVQWKGADAYKSVNRKIWKVASTDKEVAGYVRRTGNFYQVLVRNAGHMVPYDQPRAAYDMITRFVYGKDF